MKKLIMFLVLPLMAPLGVAPALAAASAPTNTAAASKPALNPSDLFGDTVVAKGKGFEIKRGQLDDMMVNIKSSAVAGGQTIQPDQMALLEQRVLDQLIQIQLLLAKATDADKAKGQETSAKRFEEIKTRAVTEEQLNRQLKSVGMTQTELKSKMTDEATARVVLERELKINISDDEVKKFYNDNPSQFEEPEMVRASHILFSTLDPSTRAELSAEQKAAKRKKAEEVLKRARAGEEFAKLAKEYSEDPGSKDRGGEYVFPRASADPRRGMVPEFEAAAFSLKTNEVSDIVTTQFGYHVIKLSEKIPARKVELAKVESNIKDYLIQQALQKQSVDYMAQLKKDAGVEILDERLKPKESSTTPVVPLGQPPLEPTKK